jgi:hypothetical protein
MSAFTGFNIVTKKRVVDVGPVQIDKTERTPVYWSPITGIILMVVGGVVLLAGRRKLN